MGKNMPNKKEPRRGNGLGPWVFPPDIYVGDCQKRFVIGAITTNSHFKKKEITPLIRTEINPNTSKEVGSFLKKKGGKRLICVGVNPSSANADFSDPTLRSVQRIAMLNNYDGWLMLNLYPQCTPNPDNLDEQILEVLHKENLKYIREALHACGIFLDKKTVWAAWGNSIERQGYLINCLRDINAILEQLGFSWISFSRNMQGQQRCATNGGHPFHPLFMPNNAQPRPYNVQHYFNE